MGEAKRRKKLDPNYGKPNSYSTDNSNKNYLSSIKSKLNYKKLTNKEELDKNYRKWYLHDNLNSPFSMWKKCQGFYNNIFHYLRFVLTSGEKLGNINDYRILVDKNKEIQCIAILNNIHTDFLGRMSECYSERKSEDAQLWKKYLQYSDNCSKSRELKYIAVAPWHLGKKTGIGTVMLQEIANEFKGKDIISEVLFDTEDFFINSQFLYLVPSFHENQNILIYSQNFHINPVKRDEPYIGFSQLPQLNFDFEGIILNPLTAEKIVEDLIALRQKFIKNNNQNEEEYFIEARKIIGTYIKQGVCVDPNDYSEIGQINDPNIQNVQLNVLTCLFLNLAPEKYSEYGIEKAKVIMLPKISSAMDEIQKQIKKGNKEIHVIPDMGTAFIQEYQEQVITLRLIPEHTITVVHKDICAIQFCANVPLKNTFSPYIGVVWFSPVRWQLKYQQKINDNKPFELLITPWKEKKYIAEDKEQVIPFQIVDQGESIFTIETEESLIKPFIWAVGGYLTN
jgi:hypothetical protein